MARGQREQQGSNRLLYGARQQPTPSLDLAAAQALLEDIGLRPVKQPTTSDRLPLFDQQVRHGQRLSLYLAERNDGAVLLQLDGHIHPIENIMDEKTSALREILEELEHKGGGDLLVEIEAFRLQGYPTPLSQRLEQLVPGAEWQIGDTRRAQPRKQREILTELLPEHRAASLKDLWRSSSGRAAFDQLRAGYAAVKISDLLRAARQKSR